MSLCIVAYVFLCLLQKILSANITLSAKPQITNVRMTEKNTEEHLTDGDPIWKEMMRYNPYPETCSESVLKSKTDLRSCILGQKWSTEMPTNRRRLGTNDYNFLSELHEIITERSKTDPNNDKDCLKSTRYRVREVPFQCYIASYGKWNETYWHAFVSEVINELRFTFDFVLYDETVNARIENKFWYLMLFLKKMVMEIPNPYLIAQVIKAIPNNKSMLNKKVDELNSKVNTLESSLLNKLKTVTDVFDKFKNILSVGK